ncbi:hypothetical protein Sjap_002128 [Stephania japonica]|uniref:Uncharacterized protein n=1 Tax=Stephania japonica TaxID=461633 RepID=A0AAP0KLB0_9MAGN
MNKKKSSSPLLQCHDRTDDAAYQSEIGSADNDDSKDTDDECHTVEEFFSASLKALIAPVPGENAEVSGNAIDLGEDDAVLEGVAVELGGDDALGGEVSQLGGNAEDTQKKVDDVKANEPVDEVPMGD